MNFILEMIIRNVFDVLQVIIIIRVCLSWIPHDNYNQYISFIHLITEPILRPIKEIFPMQFSGFDFSPVIAFFLLGLIKKFLLLAV